MPSHRRDSKALAEIRRAAFASFVRAALADARTVRGWTGVRVAEQTGLSRQTINRWVRGEWTTDPEPARVVAFCEALGIDPRTAFAPLGWGHSVVTGPGEPVTAMDPDVAALLRRLLDPRVADEEKYHIRETIRYLAYRPTPASAHRAPEEQAS